MKPLHMQFLAALGCSVLIATAIVISIIYSVKVVY